LPIALDARDWSSPQGSYALGAALLDVLRVLTVGITQPLGEATAALIGAGALLALGLWPAIEGNERGREREQPSWLDVATVLFYLAIPVGLFFAFELYKPAWLKFLVIALAPFHILVAHGAETLTHLASRASRLAFHVSRFTFCALLVFASIFAILPSLQNLYFDPAYARDDYRQIAADIRVLQPPEAAIVLNAPNQWEVFTYYYPDRAVYPAPYHPAPDKPQRFLTPILAQHERLFVLYWGDAESDPHKRFESWLATHAYKAFDRWYGDVRLALYGVAPLPEEPATPLNVCFGEVVQLRGYAVADWSVAPGEIVPVTLFWGAREAIDASYKVSVQVLDSESGLLAQVDTAPRDGLAPTTTWRSEQTLVDRYGILIPDGAPSGRYRLAVALYHPSTGQRLSVTVEGESTGDYFALDDLVVKSE
jgi:hypothetical protein